MDIDSSLLSKNIFTSELAGKEETVSSWTTQNKKGWRPTWNRKSKTGNKYIFGPKAALYLKKIKKKQCSVGSQCCLLFLLLPSGTKRWHFNFRLVPCMFDCTQGWRWLGTYTGNAILVMRMWIIILFGIWLCCWRRGCPAHNRRPVW